MQITRRQLINEINDRLPDDRPSGNSFMARGARMKFDRALSLRRCLERGEVPTTAQVVGYFGAGARFVEGN